MALKETRQTFNRTYPVFHPENLSEVKKELQSAGIKELLYGNGPLTEKELKHIVLEAEKDANVVQEFFADGNRTLSVVQAILICKAIKNDKKIADFLVEVFPCIFDRWHYMRLDEAYHNERRGSHNPEVARLYQHLILELQSYHPALFNKANWQRAVFDLEIFPVLMLGFIAFSFLCFILGASI